MKKAIAIGILGVAAVLYFTNPAIQVISQSYWAATISMVKTILPMAQIDWLNAVLSTWLPLITVTMLLMLVGVYFATRRLNPRLRELEELVWLLKPQPTTTQGPDDNQRR